MPLEQFGPKTPSRKCFGSSCNDMLISWLAIQIVPLYTNFGHFVFDVEHTMEARNARHYLFESSNDDKALSFFSLLSTVQVIGRHYALTTSIWELFLRQNPLRYRGWSNSVFSPLRDTSKIWMVSCPMLNHASPDRTQAGLNHRLTRRSISHFNIDDRSVWEIE